MIYPSARARVPLEAVILFNMKTKLSPTLAGTFVIGALVLTGRGAADTADIQCLLPAGTFRGLLQ